MEWAEGMACRVTEHDEEAREPREGGQVLPAVVERVSAVYVRAGGNGLPVRDFYRESGWSAQAGDFRWRLLPAGDEDAAAAAGTEG